MKYTVTIVKTTTSVADITVSAENEKEAEKKVLLCSDGDIENAEGYYEVLDWDVDDEHYHVTHVEPEE